MAYQVLARKYRPQQFADVVGQAHVTDTLRNAITKNRVAHAYLFVGPRGIGKTSIARILAKALNCREGPTPTPCDRCDSCTEIIGARNLDVLEFDAASTTQVDKIREIIIDRVAYAPTRGPLKIYIVDEVHMLSTSSFNALLKTLEEPPEHVTFIFATTDPQKIPATIASRCQRFDLRRIARADIIRHLQTIATAEGITISEDALLALARGAEGGLRDAESALDQLIAFRGEHIEESDVLSVFGLAARRELEGLAKAITEGDIPDILSRVAALDAQGMALPRLVVELLEYYRDLLAVRLAPDKHALDLPETHCEGLAEHAGRIEPARILRLVDVLSEAESGIRRALSQKTMLEVALIRCARAARAVSLEEILRRIVAFRESMDAAGPSEPPARTDDSSAPEPAEFSPKEKRVPHKPKEPSTVSPDHEREQLNAAWVPLVEEIASAVPRARSGLFDASVVLVDTARVTIGIDPEFAGELGILEEARTSRVLGRALSHRLGRKVVPRFEVLSPGIAAAADAPPPPADAPDAPDTPLDSISKPDDVAESPPRESVRNRLLQDPGVRRALDLFDGTIVDVRG